MNFDDLALGWREALLGAVALLVLYVGIVFYRLRRLRRAQAGTPVPAPPDAVAGSEPVVAEQVAAAYAAEPDFPWNEPPDAPPDEVRLASVEREINRLRSELVAVRGELTALAGAMTGLHEDFRQGLERVNDQVQAAQHVAPIYGDAMQMALAGHDAAAIAERCGIARAEAELVLALIRNRDDEDSEGGESSMMKER